MAASSTDFPRARRLSTEKEYARIFAAADRAGDRYFTVLARPNARSSARLGLAISRRVAPRAVDRNRLRRQIRESFRCLELAPLDYVVMARQAALSADNKTLRASLERHFGALSARAASEAHG